MSQLTAPGFGGNARFLDAVVSQRTRLGLLPDCRMGKASLPFLCEKRNEDRGTSQTLEVLSLSWSLDQETFTGRGEERPGGTPLFLKLPSLCPFLETLVLVNLLPVGRIPLPILIFSREMNVSGVANLIL